MGFLEGDLAHSLCIRPRHSTLGWVGRAAGWLAEFGARTALWMCADELQARCGPAAGEENHQAAVRPHQRLPL